jgi:hypothetical protein
MAVSLNGALRKLQWYVSATFKAESLKELGWCNYLIGCAVSFVGAVISLSISPSLFKYQDHINATRSFVGSGLAHPAEFGFALLGFLSGAASGILFSAPLAVFGRLGHAGSIVISLLGIITLAGAFDSVYAIHASGAALCGMLLSGVGGLIGWRNLG